MLVPSHACSIVCKVFTVIDIGARLFLILKGGRSVGLVQAE